MTLDLTLGDTKLIIEACRRHGLLRNQAAYVLATAYWETARQMKPVIEAFWLSDGWRRKNLRYYPWFGRGYVQLTWERNYHRAGVKLGLDLTSDPNRVLEPDIAADILVIGSRDGWFTGKRLDEYITLATSNYRGARQVINGTDKAFIIAEIAREYEAALFAAGYAAKGLPVIDAPDEGSPSDPAVAETALSGSGKTVGVVGAVGAGFVALITAFGCKIPLIATLMTRCGG